METIAGHRLLYNKSVCTENVFCTPMDPRTEHVSFRKLEPLFLAFLFSVFLQEKAGAVPLFLPINHKLTLLAGIVNNSVTPKTAH